MVGGLLSAGSMRTQRLRLDGQDAALQRDTSSEVNLGSFGETGVWLEGVSVCVYV